MASEDASTTGDRVGDDAASADAARVASAPPGPSSVVPEIVVAPAAEATASTPAPDTVETLGEILLAAREARGLSLEEASARTRISAPMLRNLEADRFAELPAEAYVRGFLRNYGSFLGLDQGMLLRRYEGIVGQRIEPAPEVWEEVVVPPPPARHWKPNPKVLIVLGLAGLSVLGYSAWKLTGGPESWGLRPKAGLEQIESELRESQQARSAETLAAVSAPSESATTGTGVDPALAAVQASPAPHPAPAIEPAPIAAASVANSSSSVARHGEDTSPGVRPPVTDMVEEPQPVEPAAKAPRPPTPKPAEAAEGRTLVLTATALDSCALHLQVDDDARHAHRYQFTRRGESRTWTAHQSFRVAARRTPNLELRLNGKLVVLPTQGRELIIDRSTLGSGMARRESPAPTPRAASARRRPSRAPGRAAAPRAASLEHAAGPPR